MFQGGSLIPDKAFKKIISIGYEFETHDLSKLSLHSNKTSLINSSLSLRTLEDKLERGSIQIVDDNYIEVRIPIHEDDKPPKEKLAEIEAKNAERAKGRAEEVMEEMDEEEREFMAEFQEEYEEEMEQEKRASLLEKENETYLEYLNENRKSDNKKTIKFQITNDIGDGDFADVVKAECDDVNIAKNDMYFFKTNSGKMYDFKFSEETTDSCQTFTGVEFIITYYSPKKENANIITDTFVDACSRIVDHLGNLKKTTGTLLIEDTKKTHYTPIGLIENERCLYHKPGTNLYYMDTYDRPDLEDTQNLGEVDFVPQMTFKCKALDMIEIMKEILGIEQFKKGRSVIEVHELDLEELHFIESLIDASIENYNKTAKLGADRKRRTISVETDMAKNLKTYMFFIYYKLYYYIQNHKVILNKETEDYLKDYLSFASRHNNYVLYSRIKQILKEAFDITEIDEIHRLLCNPSVMAPIYKIDDPEKTDHNYEGSVRLDLPKTSPNYGDPLHSLSSYFKHFEDPKTSNSLNDWLMESMIDSFSSTFALKSDEMLVENRFFRYEIGLWLRNTVDPKLSKDTLKVREMFSIVNKLYGPNIKKMMNLEKNPIKNKLSKKCKTGYYRSLDFDCVKMKPRKTVKKAKRSRSTSHSKTGKTSKKGSA